jgi:hypothetical protein
LDYLAVSALFNVNMYLEPETDATGHVQIERERASRAAALKKQAATVRIQKARPGIKQTRPD